jgi:beta-phosphoglucomutase-like phosphatase (HAD superfamily)
VDGFFDLDDTLIDTSERHYKVYEDILRIYSIETSLSRALSKDSGTEREWAGKQ